MATVTVLPASKPIDLAGVHEKKKHKKHRKREHTTPLPPPTPPPQPPPPPPPPPLPSSVDLQTTPDFKPGELFQAMGFDVSPSSSDTMRSPVSPVSPMTELAVVAEKEYDLNICLIHPPKLELFTGQLSKEYFVRCPFWKQCGVFCPRDKQNGYMAVLNKKVHQCYQQDFGQVKCQCNKQTALRISHSQLNPLRPFFTCRNKGGCPFFQWAGVEFTDKNAKLQQLLKDSGKF